MAQKIEKLNTDRRFTEAYHSLYPFVFRYSIAKLGNVEDAEECAQEAFYILYRKYCNGVIIENPKAFLVKTVNNVVMKKPFTKHKNTYFFEDVGKEPEAAEEESELFNIEYSELIGIIEDMLGEPDKTIFRLRYVQEKSVKEISLITGISITNITTRISRFRGKVQKEITKWRR